MKSSLKTVRVVHTQVIDKAKKLEIENINFINGGLAAEVSIIVDELEFYGCRIWRDEAGRAASVVSVPEIINFRTARCAVPVIKVSEKIKHAIAVMADDILQKVKPCRYDQTNYQGITSNRPPCVRIPTFPPNRPASARWTRLVLAPARETVFIGLGVGFCCRKQQLPTFGSNEQPPETSPLLSIRANSSDELDDNVVQGVSGAGHAVANGSNGCGSTLPPW